MLGIRVAVATLLVTGLATGATATDSQSCLQSSFDREQLLQCPDANFAEADAELNRVYKEIRKQYQNDKQFLAKLLAAQRAWIKLRNADLELHYPHANTPGYYGSVLPTCQAQVKTKLTLERVAFLKLWLASAEEGDVCLGSRRLP